jgi:hypothetical protein
MPGRRKDGNHPAVQKRPRRFSMQHQDWIGLGRAVFHPRHPQCAAILVGELAIPWEIRKFRQTVEMFVGRSQYLHGGEHTAELTIRTSE